ncbi:unknown [Clostridium sp. CAG:729]|nr:unknown [Clostridium sp. CAG:729]
MATAITRAMADGAEIGLKMTSAQTVQESKNLFQMSWKEAMNFLRNKNMLKTNSEEYLTYKLKQNMPGPKIDVNVEELIR